MAVSKRRASNAIVEAVWGAHTVLDPERGAVALPKTVSHYTDSAGALGILQARELWATDALFMNDETELRFARPLLDAAWQHSAERFVPNEQARAPFWASFSRAFRRVDTDPQVHVVCFCEDGDLLSQWRGYGLGGGGYSIQLATKTLYESSQIDFGLSFHKVIYEPTEQQRLAENFLRAGTEPLRNFPAADEETLQYAALQVGTTLGTMAISYAMRIKDSAFREEDEWRLVYQPSPDGIDAEHLTREFRATSRGVLPYVRIREGTTGASIRNLKPRSVTVGPTGARTSLAKRAMEYLLHDRHGDDVHVRESAIPLRA